jgi:hypothetical protein
MKQNSFFLGCIISLFLFKSCGPGGQTPPSYRTPVLETVVQENVGARIVPELPDNSYMIFGAALLHFRVLGDVNIKVIADGVTLPRRAQSTATSGWYEPNGSAVTASRNYFWDIAVQLPASALAVGKTNFPIEFVYDTSSSTPQPELRVTLRLQGRDPNYVKAHPRPSDVFVDSTDNTKDDNRMERSIVAQGVTLAGWITGSPDEGPGRNDGNFSGTTATEDWHYHIYVDPDFIERNYGTAYPVEPIHSAALPGNVVPLIAGPATPIPLVPAGAKPSASTFLISGSGILGVELNAWHESARGPKPSGWVSDPDQLHHSDNAWPYDPRKGSNDPNGPDLQTGDYVIVSGTLWQDTAHTAGNADPLHKCMDSRFKGHGGWLELHPVDTVRRADPPPIRKHVVGLSRCGPDAQTFSVMLRHPQAPPDKNAQLMFQVLVDGRFTSANATHSESINPACEPPALSATADATATGSYNAAYILWWQESNTPRTGTAVCLPAVNPVLGPAKD